MGDVKAWPKPTGTPMRLPNRVVRPCDHGLVLAARELETQLGTIEAYNRLVECAQSFKARIDAGDIKPQNPLFAKSVRGEV